MGRDPRHRRRACRTRPGRSHRRMAGGRPPDRTRRALRHRLAAGATTIRWGGWRGSASRAAIGLLVLVVLSLLQPRLSDWLWAAEPGGGEWHDTHLRWSLVGTVTLLGYAVLSRDPATRPPGGADARRTTLRSTLVARRRPLAIGSPAQNDGARDRADVTVPSRAGHRACRTPQRAVRGVGCPS